MSQLAPSAWFEYVCYGSTAIINSITLSKQGPILDVRILMSKVNPSAERVKPHMVNPFTTEARF